MIAAEANRQLGESVDVYLDAGPAQQQAASTIVDLTGAEPRVVRSGPVTAEQIGAVLGIGPADLMGTA